MDNDTHCRNLQAHMGLDRLGFAHKMVNYLVLQAIRRQSGLPAAMGSTRLRALDIGCGSGYLLKNMLSCGWDAWGVDPFPRGQAARAPLNRRVVKGTIEKVPGASFHVVTAVEVFEHVNDYMQLLATIMKRLHPRGVLVATVPNDWEFYAVETNGGTMTPRYGHVWRFPLASFEADLRCFSDAVTIEPIYSGSLDRRLLSITRILPRTLVQHLSRKLIHSKSDAAWLLAVAHAGKDKEALDRAKARRPSAINFYRSEARTEKNVLPVSSHEVMP